MKNRKTREVIGGTGGHRPTKMLTWFVLSSIVMSSVTEVSAVGLQRLAANLSLDNILLSRVKDFNPETKCGQHVVRYVEGLQKQDEWALMMFDSSTKFPYGILDGRFHFLGNFDECLKVTTDHFKGKYVFLSAKLYGMPSPYMFGICLPSSCAAKDINDAFSLTNSEVFNVTADERNCWTDDPIKLDTEDWIVIGFFAFIVAITLCSTAVDWLQENNKINLKRKDLYTSSSLLRNWKQLVKIYKRDDNIGCLNGLRVLSMCWVVLGHAYSVSLWNPTINLSAVKTYFESTAKLPITNALVSVDSFFILSGFLVCLIFFRDYYKKKQYDVPVAWIHRYLRLTPSFAVMVLIHSTIILKLGKGPMWNSSIGLGVEVCRENWWKGLIYLQNFLAPNSTCLGQSWYLSSDMQMFWISPVLLFPMLLLPKLAPLLLVACMVGSIMINFFVAYFYDLGPHVFVTKNTEDQFKVDYVQTHMRMTPYIVGIALGYVTCGIKAKKIKVNLSKMAVIIGWMMSTALCLGCIFGLSPFLGGETSHEEVENVLYLSLHRFGWSLGLCWVIFACTNGYGGLVNDLLSWSGFQIFGKLSYSVFLIHFTFQMYRTGITRTTYFIRDFEIVQHFFGDLCSSVILSVPLTLLVEMPVSNLDRYLLRNAVILPFPFRKKEGTDKSKEDVEAAAGGETNEGFDKKEGAEKSKEDVEAVAGGETNEGFDKKE